MTEDEYIKERLESQQKWHSHKSSTAKKWHIRIQCAEIMCAALIPVFVGFMDGPICLKIIVAVLGATVTILEGIEGVFCHRDIWLGYRAVSERLKREAALFKTHSGPYKEEGNSFLLFVERTENILENGNSQWQLNLFSSVSKNTRIKEV